MDLIEVIKMKDLILSLQAVSKKINGKEIIKDIDFSIQRGEVLGFLGPNGAGKSTTLRMIVGLSRPTSGKIIVSGYSIQKDYVKAMSKVGAIIEGPDLYDYMTGYKNLEMLGAMSSNVTVKDIMSAVKLVGMEHRIHDKVGTYSMGMKQRLGLAQALIHQPELLILDEPTNGLDPQGIYEFREIIKNLATEKNISVLVSSHLIAEVQLMCDNVSIINQGKIIKSANVHDLLSTGEVFWVVDRREEACDFLNERFHIQGTCIDNRIEAVVDVSKLETINASLIHAGFKLQYISAKNKTLEELFLSLTNQQGIM